MKTGALICSTCGVTLWDVDTLPCSTAECPIPVRIEAIEDWEVLRREAFKRIIDKFRNNRRRTKERLRWMLENPSPRTDAERAVNLRRTLFVQ
jgi:hypothetical protein